MRVHIDVITSMANSQVFFLSPAGTPGPPVHPRGNFHQTDFPPLSCSVLRVPALLWPHPSGAPAGASSRGVPSRAGDLAGYRHSKFARWAKSFKGTKQIERAIIARAWPRADEIEIARIQG